MKNEIKTLDRIISEILESLEYNTKKEESIVNVLLKKYDVKRDDLKNTSNNISSKIVKNKIDLEDFFSNIFKYFKPFSLMIEEIYQYLNNYSVNIDSRATQVKFNFEKLKEKLTFDISNFPKELIHTFSFRSVNKLLSIYEINLWAKGKYESNYDNQPALRFITGYDGDFYNFFLTPVSYFWSLKEKANSFSLYAFQQLENELDIIFEDIEFLLNTIFQEYNIKPKKIIISFWGKLEGNVIELNKEDHSILLEKGFDIIGEGSESIQLSNIIYELNCLALALQFWRKKYKRVDFDRHNWAFKKDIINQIKKSPEIYIDYIRRQIDNYRKALNDIIVFKGYKNIQILIEDILQFIRLPYWKHRWHIYELWTLFHCLNNLKNSYEIKINLKDHGDYLELVVPKAIAKQPVAKIFSNEKELQCWFQRKTINPLTGKGLEPDLRFMTNDDFPIDIFIIENKDRRNCSGLHIQKVKNKYLEGTIAKSIWIVNYENYFGKNFSKNLNLKTINNRNVWIASNFKPTNIPPEFYIDFSSTLNAYLNPSGEQKEALSYDLIIDKSGSMNRDSILNIIEKIYSNFNYNPEDIYLYDTSLINTKFNDIKKLYTYLKCSGGTELVRCFEQYMKSEDEFPKLVYVITDGDGFDECYNDYNLKMLDKGSSLVFLKI